MSPRRSQVLLLGRVGLGESCAAFSLEAVPCLLGALTSRVTHLDQGLALGHPRVSLYLSFWVGLFSGLLPGCVLDDQLWPPEAHPKAQRGSQWEPDPVPSSCPLHYHVDLGPPYSLKRWDLGCLGDGTLDARIQFPRPQPPFLNRELRVVSAGSYGPQFCGLGKGPQWG